MNTSNEHATDVSRRRFVTASTAAVGAAALVSPALASSAFARGDDRIRVGLIGCGGRGSGAAQNALNADPGVVLVSMGDAFSDRLENSRTNLVKHAGDRVNVPPDQRFVGFDAYQEVIDSDVDVVILATPPHFRPEHLEAAVKAGKHVFTEKPMAVDGPGVRKVLEASRQAKQQGTALMSGFCWRYNIPNRECYARLHGGAIGDITTVHSTYLAGPLGKRPRQDGWSDMEWQMRNWQHFNWLSGDHIVEQAVHAIDKINWAMNNRTPVRCYGVGGRLCREGLESGDIYDHHAVLYEYDNGARAFHMCRQIPGCWGDNTEYIIGTKGNCFVNSWGPTQIIKGPDNEVSWQYKGPNPNMYQVEHDELFKAIREGTPVNDGDFMAQSTLMGIMGRMANYTGESVTWDDALNSPERLGPDTYAFGDYPMPPVTKPDSAKIAKAGT
ncbi:MAG: Gfo/Idh/MocA family oxidoreductase [Planctomycetota bacterium]|nr:Gfo/Idh/MocA family oxidoreductase [Planctomycetota bacterium]